jgi:CRP/FNR family transcriptional regulator, cyclic AMP receptor protein
VTAAPLLAKFLHVRRSELDRTLQVAGFAILLGWAMYTAFNATQAIFLNKAGPHAYPLFFVVLALAVWPMVALQGVLTRRLGVGRALRLTLVLNAVIAPILYIVYFISEAPTVAFSVYVIYSIAFELVMLNFWSFVSQHFNLLEGKRIFPVIAAGLSIGYILAGFTTTLIAIYATEPLLFVWAFGAAAAALMSEWVERRLFRPSFVDDADELFAQEQVVRHRQGAMRVLRGAVQYLTSSRLVLALVLLGLVMQVTSRVGDYLVALIFVGATHNNLQELTILIGNAWLASYVVQLGISLFVTPWVLNKLGVKNAIMALPIFTLIGFVAVAVNPVLATSLFLFIVRNGLQTGLDDPAESVLGGALPAQVGPKLKVLLDNVVLPGAAVITGIGLLLVQQFVSATVQVLAVIGIVLAVLFIAAALRVRSLYVDAIYERLRTHAVSLNDFQRALGRPTPAQIDELRGFVRTGDDRARPFAAAALGRLAPETFAAMVPELLASPDASVRRLALQLAPPKAVTDTQLQAAVKDPDGWVVAAAAVAGAAHDPPWDQSGLLLHELWSSSDPDRRAAAVWAAAFTGDRAPVVDGMRDGEAVVRLEAIRSFAKLKAEVPEAAGPMVACMRDDNLEVRREALRQAVRWAPTGDERPAFAEALVASLASGDREVRRLASEAMAAQAPEALALTLPLLESREHAAAAAVEALIRSGRPDLFRRVKAHLEQHLGDGVKSARMSTHAAASARLRVDGDEAAAYAFLRIALDDYAGHATDSGLGAMRALHGKRGFATVERGVLSTEPQARAEGLETLLNFGPGWLAAPLAQLLDPDAFDGASARALSDAELEALANHTDKWIHEAAGAAVNGLGDGMKELIALKRVPLFSTLTLEQLSSIDHLMVTRHYEKGESIFLKGDVGSELFVVLEGEIRIHVDHEGREVTLARLGPSSVVGEMAVFDDQPRSAGAQASDNTTVRVLRRDRLQALVHEHPEVLLEFVKNLSQRIRVMNEQLEAGTQAAAGSVVGS